MRNGKTALCLALTAALLVGGAFLPKGADLLLDGNKSDGVAYTELRTVELNLKQDEAGAPEGFEAKLALYGGMYTVPVGEEAASLSREQALAAAVGELTAYMDAGLMAWCDFTYQSLELYIGIDPLEPNNNNLFWTVSFVEEGEPYSSIFLHLDDETGKILYLTYDSQLVNYDEAERQRVAELVPELYFTALGMEDVYQHGVNSALRKDALVSSCTVSAPAHGEITFECVVSEQGFEIVFSCFGESPGQ